MSLRVLLCRSLTLLFITFTGMCTYKPVPHTYAHFSEDFVFISLFLFPPYSAHAHTSFWSPVGMKTM